MNNNNFQHLGLDERLLEAITKKGFEKPSEIQSLTIPFALSSTQDFIAQAQTGTGKTAAFGLPILQILSPQRTIPQALILVPTRELALQVTQELQSFNYDELSITPIYGGASIEEQLRRLKKGADIVVGTPGRILDHIKRKTLNLSELKFLVLDEADEMLNMGFIEDIELIMAEMPETKRTMLFSATMPERIRSLVHLYMSEPETLKVEAQHLTTDLTNQIYFEVRESDKFEALTRIIDVEADFYGIVFSRTKVGVDEIVHKLNQRGYSAEGLHGDISQAQREKILHKFKQKLSNVLVATDVAARGIDINNLTHVVNYSLPQDNESYVHRIGRTGRAGNEGTAITFISPSEARQFGFLKKKLKAEITKEQIPSSADVVSVKRTRIKDELEEIIASENYSESLPMAFDLLGTHDPEIALAALLRLAFKNELSESNYPEIRSISVDKKGKARIFIALGSDDGFNPRGIVKLLKSECRLSDHDIDDISVMDSYTFATVPYSQANNVVKALNASADGAKIAEITKESKSDSGKKGRKSGGKKYDAAEGGSSRRERARSRDGKGKSVTRRTDKSRGRDVGFPLAEEDKRRRGGRKGSGRNSSSRGRRR
ncbi:MAG: DEAD/DEAH box helicase [Rikenellaceae bacterium]